ncbi:MAG: hypothetical protein M1834_009629 [Cirrosporium novae-zelandiae]|nr:MAG: hypothetical protein M1834_009629 [Cirrosporium novae-zelandiae]
MATTTTIARPASTEASTTPTRFTLELEFVQSLSSPQYLLHLSTLSSPTGGRLLSHPPFIAYLKYLLYFTKPEYAKYLSFPGPTLHVLKLLQEEKFREDTSRPDIVMGILGMA